MNHRLAYSFFGILLLIFFCIRISGDFPKLYLEQLTISWPGLALITGLLILANLLRTLRTKVILDQAKKGNWLVEFGILSIGSLTNFVIPFRLGEFARAFLLSKYLSVSFLFTLVTIFLERILDVFVISFVILLSNISGAWFSPTHWFAAISLVVSAALLLLFILLVYENIFVIRLLRKLSEFTSEKLEWKIKHSLWTVIHGYQKFFKNPLNSLKYLSYLLITWLIYFVVINIIWQATNSVPSESHVQTLMSPFIIPDSIVGNQNFAQYAQGLNDYLLGLKGYEPSSAQAFISYTWLLLNIPIALIGIFSVISGFIYLPNTQNVEIMNKRLDRTNTPNEKLSQFVESFLNKETIANQIHKDDVSGDIQLLGFFKGGSAAVTALIHADNSLRVRKIVDQSNQDKLRNQYVWLRNYASLPLVVNPIEEHFGVNTYSYDLEYCRNSTSLFDYIHSNPLSESESIIRQVLVVLRESVYKELNPTIDQNLFESYVHERLLERVSFACNKSETINKVASSKFVEYNGNVLLGFHYAIETIFSNKKILKTLSTFQTCQAIHGDLTIDNILVDENRKPIIIDPSDDNQIRGPVIDYARLFQSLAGGYEILNSNSSSPEITFDTSTGVPKITYIDLKSQQYSKIAENLKNEISEHLLPEELISLDFHIGMLFGRMLSHRVQIDESTTAIYFVRCLEFLNKFILDNNISPKVK